MGNPLCCQLLGSPSEDCGWSVCFSWVMPMIYIEKQEGTIAKATEPNQASFHVDRFRVTGCRWRVGGWWILFFHVDRIDPLDQQYLRKDSQYFHMMSCRLNWFWCCVLHCDVMVTLSSSPGFQWDEFGYALHCFQPGSNLQGVWQTLSPSF